MTAQRFDELPVAEWPKVLKIEEAARVLRCSRSTAYDAARRGEIPTVSIGRRLLVPTARLLAMIGLDGGSQGGTDAGADAQPQRLRDFSEPQPPDTTSDDRPGEPRTTPRLRLAADA